MSTPNQVECQGKPGGDGEVAGAGSAANQVVVGQFDDAEESVWDTWDPMSQNFVSFQNLNCPDIPRLMQGTAHLKGTICPHSNDQGGCFKGRLCPYEHHIDPKIIEECPKMSIPLEPLQITHRYHLPSQSAITVNAIFPAQVVVANSPDDFYIVPKQGPECICKKREDEIGYDNFSMAREMKAFYSKREFRNDSDYVEMQLVTIREHLDFGQICYWRGMTLEDFIAEDDDVPDLPIFFLDLGISKNVSLVDIGRLPKLFASIPPLAYKCNLYGIQPRSRRYSRVVKEKFQELVYLKQVLVTLKAPYDEDDLFESEPCIVEVRVLIDPSKYLYANVKDELLKTGDLVAPNADPLRPCLWSGMTDAEVDLLFDRSIPWEDYELKAEEYGKANIMRMYLRQNSHKLQVKEPELASVAEQTSVSLPNASAEASDFDPGVKS